MNLESIAIIVIVVLLLILCAFTIPFLIQLRKTINNINITLQTLNQHLPGILKNMEDITTNVNSITSHVNKQVEGVIIPILRLKTLLLNLALGMESVLHTNINKFHLIKAARNMPAVLKGLQVFFQTLRSKVKETDK
jgi:predicted PurR-regulated permease PerM